MLSVIIKKIQKLSTYILKENELANQVIENNRSQNYLKYEHYKINSWFVGSLLSFTLCKAFFDTKLSMYLAIICLVFAFLSFVYNIREVIFYIKNYKKFIVKNSPTHVVATVLAGCKTAAPVVKSCIACLGGGLLVNEIYSNMTGVNPMREYSQVMRGNQSLQNANEHMNSGLLGHGHPLQNELDLEKIKSSELNDTIQRQQRTIENLSKHVDK